MSLGIAHGGAEREEIAVVDTRAVGVVDLGHCAADGQDPISLLNEVQARAPCCVRSRVERQ